MGATYLVRATALALCLSACSGLVSGPDGPAGSGGGGGDRVVEGVKVGPGYLRRLTRTQYVNSVSDLFGTTITVNAQLPSDDGTVGFSVGKVVSENGAEAYFDAAEEIAETVTGNLDALLPCAAASVDDACVDAFIADFGPRAFRRPLTAEEVSEWKALYATGRDAYGTREGVQLIVQAALSSPSFVYLVEEESADAKPGSIVRLKPYEVASRLSYLAWNSAPDAELLQAAADGRLDTAAGAESELARMLNDEAKSKRGLRNFYEQWLLVSNLPLVQREASSGYNAQVSAAMADSFARFVDDVVWTQNGSVRDLLLGDFTYVSAALMPILGDVGSPGDDMVRMDGVPNRLGLLSQPAVLAVTASSMENDPIHRGKFVREQILCEHLAAKPDAAAIEASLAKEPLRELPQDAPPRDHAEARLDQSYCTGCHKFMDPIGFGFENFDGIGRFTNAGADESGEVVAGAAPGKFTNFNGLVNHLAESDAVNDCVTQQFFRYALGRYEGTDDAHSVAQLRAALTEENGAITAMLRGIASSDAFLHRKITSEPKEP